MTDPAPQKIARALISVSDKSGLVPFGRFLAEAGVEIVSTGGSARELREAGVPVTDVSDRTGFPEMLDGRVKTLHPAIHGGILARRDRTEHMDALAEHGIAAIDLVVVNLYPFEATVAGGADPESCIENIDIGGPALIRAAAKNHASVTVVTDPADYEAVTAEMREQDGRTTPALRRRLAAAAFARTAAYDAAIARWLAEREGETFPPRLSLPAVRRQMLRYGENPHQQAAFYAAAGPGDPRPGVATAVQVQGKALSFNNLNDTDAAFELAAEFDRPAVVIVKHANPCGVAVADDLATAYARALACDPVSAYGGIVAVNRPLDAATAEAIAALFVEVVIAPQVEAAARAVLAGKKNLRMLEAGGLPDPAAPGLTVRSLAGGYLLQGRDNGRVDPAALKVVSKRAPSERERADLLFAFAVAKHVKSNAIVYARDGATVGIGAGQMSRVDSARIAAWKAQAAAKAAGGGESRAKGSVVASDAFFPFADGLVAAAGEGESRAQGSVVASDAFFPFADGLLAAAEAGATAVIQPGGSLRDEEVIAAADAADLAMVFTGIRHFRH